VGGSSRRSKERRLHTTHRPHQQSEPHVMAHMCVDAWCMIVVVHARAIDVHHTHRSDFVAVPRSIRGVPSRTDVDNWAGGSVGVPPRGVSDGRWRDRRGRSRCCGQCCRSHVCACCDEKQSNGTTAHTIRPSSPQPPTPDSTPAAASSALAIDVASAMMRVGRRCLHLNTSSVQVSEVTTEALTTGSAPKLVFQARTNQSDSQFVLWIEDALQGRVTVSHAPTDEGHTNESTCMHAWSSASSHCA
jgi:hypothetical protein